MTAHINSTFIGERVRWHASSGWSPGTGHVDAIYLGMHGLLTYRVEREGSGYQDRYVLLKEGEIEPAASEEVPHA